MRSEANISAVLMAIISTLIAVTIPAGYSIIAYNHLGGTVDAEIAYFAHAIEPLAINNPGSWHFEEIRLREILERRLRAEHKGKLLIRDARGVVVAEAGEPSAGPVRVFREPIYDGGEIIGHIEAEISLFPLFLKTVLVLAFSCLLGVAVFLLFWRFALRSVRRIEEARRKSEEFFRAITENSVDMVFIVNEEGTIKYASPSAERIIGYGPDELAGVSAYNLILSEDHPRAISDFSQALLTRNIDIHNSFRIRHKNGDVLVLEGTGKNLVQDPVIAGFIMNVRDVTDRKRAEEEKAKLQEQLLQSRKMEFVGRLAGGVAHDFNNMLGVIIGNIELALRRIDPNHPVRTRLEDIGAAAERSADLTRQLLAFARKQTVSPRVIDINLTIEGMLKMLRRLIGEDIQLTWLPSSELWPVRIDPSQVDQLLANLCINARDAIAGVGEIAIRTANIALDEAYCADHVGAVAGEYVLLSVSDNGSGMSKEVLDSLFEPFFTTKELGYGTGLGLATVYGIVKQNNGSIDVESESGRGATFRIYLPRHLGRMEQDGIKGETPVAGGNETVLVVEDEGAVLVMMSRMLEEKGYRVLAAEKPAEAISIAQQYGGDIHLLITDIIMPGMNGKDMAQKLRSFCPNLKCLFMSGYTADVIGHHDLLGDGVHFIEKPFSTNELALKVRKVLGP